MNVRKSGKRAAHNGSTIDSFLEAEGIREEVEAVAIKRVLAWQIERALQEQKKTNKRSRKFDRVNP
jgi:antitoxin HicB